MHPVSRRRALQLAAVVTGAAALPTRAVAATSGSQSIVVDPSSQLGPFNRALFSVVGVTQDTGLKADSWALLNPAGTQSRLGLDMNGLVPEKGAFNVDKMFLYMDNTDDKFFNQVVDAGMEPVILCAYDMSWLGEHGHSNDPPADPQEWADIIAQVAQHFNSERLRVRYLEIWNEPNTTQFWTGTPQQYVDLFTVTARTIHEKCPGVQVGGPVFSPGIDGYYEYGRAFIDAAGDDMDYFIYHSYGDDPPKIAADIELWRDYIAAHTRHSDPKLMVTEAEQFKDSDAVKLQNLISRQFTLLDYADTMLGWHQFKLYEYQEGWYTFGMVYNDGSVFNRNYWPYWLFRDAVGTRLSVRQEIEDAAAHQVATISPDGQTVNLVHWRDPDVATANQVTRLEIPSPPTAEDRILIVSTVSGLAGEVVAARRVGHGEARCVYTAAVAPGQAVSMTMCPAAQVPAPWVGLAGSATTVAVSGEFTATVTVLNTTGRPIGGDLTLAGLPTDWRVTLQSGVTAFDRLDTGERATATWTVVVTSATNGAVAYRAVVGDWHSIPVRIQTN